ncbi:tRNA (guanine-N(7)-)-methyltransferase (tRNA(m7G46)-methyltransferase) [Microbotryomycetes sp. JL221]|nr:tRNA (guanine-N(7)-)-methyltransferase (tRNA(m7G46)-methyltransferase) [Microbotryomycetes sp. JL221]
MGRKKSSTTVKPKDEILLDGAATAQMGMPRKRFYRQRAHANPLSISNLDYPQSPHAMDWSRHFPTYFNPQESVPNPPRVEFADVGCGFGGLLISVAPLFPNTLMLGLEIRAQVTQYVHDKIQALRLNPGSVDPDRPDELPVGTLATTTHDNHEDNNNTIDNLDNDQDTFDLDQNPQKTNPQHVIITSEQRRLLQPPTGYSYDNVSVMRSNAMKYLPNYFHKASLSKMFFLFPDPHFKQRKHKARIISQTLLAEYAYALKIGGLLYTITDVPDLHTWMISHLNDFPLFKRLTEHEINQLGLNSNEGVTSMDSNGSLLNNLKEKAIMEAVKRRTEEGKKVERNNHGKQWSVWRRIEDPVVL